MRLDPFDRDNWTRLREIDPALADAYYNECRTHYRRRWREPALEIDHAERLSWERRRFAAYEVDAFLEENAAEIGAISRLPHSSWRERARRKKRLLDAAIERGLIDRAQAAVVA